MIDLYQWCRERSHRFRIWESREMAFFPSPEDRDTAIVEWVIRCLGNPEFESGDEVLKMLQERRGGGAS